MSSSIQKGIKGGRLRRTLTPQFPPPFPPHLPKMLNPRFSTLLAVLFLSIATTSSSPTHKHAKRGLDTGSIAQQRFGNDSAWYQDRIPYFDSSDSLINDVYYYRWQVLRAHQRDLGPRGYISTEVSTNRS